MPSWRFAVALLALSAYSQQSGTVAIDKTEWRDQPARHLYIHGVLNGDTAFHIFLPEPKAWKGRLLHYLQGAMGGSENFGVVLGEVPYALANGAAYVESSQGHRGDSLWRSEDTMEEIAYQANYAVVQYAKSRCVELYQSEPRATYVYGVSGGGIRSSGLLERFPKVYDGAVPVVGIGTLDQVWFNHSLYEDHRTRAGGREAIEAAGYPRGAPGALPPLGVGLLMLDVLKYKVDPAYFSDFWSKPGWSDRQRPDLVENIAGAVEMVEARKNVLADTRAHPDQRLAGYTLTFTSGEAKGQWFRVAGNQGKLMLASPVGKELRDVKAGDTFVLDNRDLLAWCEYHRRRNDRATAQRTGLIEPDRPAGKFQGKMIAVFATHDTLMWPAVAVKYAQMVERKESFRLHFVENANHGRPSSPIREVFWDTTERKAMDDLMAWVERGVTPAAGTVYTMSGSQVVLPPSARLRKGYQPVASASTAVEGGQTIFTVTAEDPDNEIIKIEIDFDHDGKFDESRDVRGRRVREVFRNASKTAVVRVTDATAGLGSATKGIQNLANAGVR